MLNILTGGVMRCWKLIIFSLLIVIFMYVSATKFILGIPSGTNRAPLIAVVFVLLWGIVYE